MHATGVLELYCFENRTLKIDYYYQMLETSDRSENKNLPEDAFPNKAKLFTILITIYIHF